MRSTSHHQDWAGRIGGARLVALFDVDRRVSSALFSLALLAFGWGALWSARSSYAVEGVVRRVVARAYPWDLVGKFDLVVKTDRGATVRFDALHGGCDNKPALRAVCVKPEFPVGGRIRVETNAFFDLNVCAGSGLAPYEFRCLGRADRRFGRADFYVTAIQVDGQPVVSGWSRNLSILSWYALVLSAAIVMWRHQWRFASVRARTMLIYAMWLWACLLAPVAWIF